MQSTTSNPYQLHFYFHDTCKDRYSQLTIDLSSFKKTNQSIHTYFDIKIFQVVFLIFKTLGETFIYTAGVFIKSFIPIVFFKQKSPLLPGPLKYIERVAFQIHKLTLWLMSGFILGLIDWFTRMTKGLKELNKSATLVSQSLDSSHMRSNFSELSVDHIPETITISMLIDIFDEMTFVKQLDCKSSNDNEYETDLNLDHLRKGLLQFVNHVENRVAYQGTPPEHDIQKIEEFYKKIEDLVRLCLYETIQNIKKFQILYGDTIDTYSIEKRSQYRSLLMSKNSLAVKLASIGLDCGGRYLSESLELYRLICNQTVSGNYDTLTVEDHLIEILAEARKELFIIIFNEKVQSFGSIEVDAHLYATTYSRLALKLGLPNSKNIIDHIGETQKTRFENTIMIDFFKIYHPLFIIETIKTKIKEDKNLREKIQLWISEYTEQWTQTQLSRKSKTSKIQSKIEQIETILNVNPASNPDDCTPVSFFKNFLHCLETHHQKIDEILKKHEIVTKINSEEPTFSVSEYHVNLDLFIHKFLKLVDKSLLTEFKINIDLTSCFFMEIRKKLEEVLIDKSLGKNIDHFFRDQHSFFYQENIQHQFHMIYTCNQIMKKVQLFDQQRIQAIYYEKDKTKQKKLIFNFVHQAYSKQFKQDFLNVFNLHTFDHKDHTLHDNSVLSDCFMEWLLVSHHIFLLPNLT